MSGHSKWSSIKRAKGATDVKRGATFTKLANTVAVTARQGGGDPSANFQLRLAIEKAREANMPKDNIERAIKRGTGEGGTARIEEMTYEAYGPEGIALLIETATDNRNRTAADVKGVLNKSSGKLAEAGSVAYLFKHRGLITVEVGGKSADEIELAIIDAGAEDFEEQNGIISVYCEPKQTESVRNALTEAGIKINDVSLSWEPVTNISITDEKKAGQVLKLMDGLEALDDVTAVHSNFDIPTELIEKLTN